MAQQTENLAQEIRRLVNGFQVTQAISVAARLGIADMLGDGPRSADSLANEAGAHAPTLYRLLQALATVDVVSEDGSKRFQLTDLGQLLRKDVPDSIHGWAAFVSEASYWAAWGDLMGSVRTGENAFRRVHGTDPWTLRSRDSEASARFDLAMAANSRQTAARLLAVYDFSRYEILVDVGGGNGALLIALLSANPQVRGVLFDRPHVVEGAAPLLAAAGLVDRCRVEGGSFFEAVPSGGDAYLMRDILHDWEDADCRKILAVCRRAVASETRLLIIERQLGGPNENWDAKFSDLNMLVAPGGRERTTEEYESLGNSAGFRLEQVVESADTRSIFEFKAV